MPELSRPHRPRPFIPSRTPFELLTPPLATWRPSLSTASPEIRAARGALLQRVRDTLRTRHYSRRTEKAYVGWISRFFAALHGTTPTDAGVDHVTAFLTRLATKDEVTASTQNQAFSALLFLFREVLERDLEGLADIPRAKRPVRLPQVLTRAEVTSLLGRLRGTPALMASIMYGGGLRVLECCRLRVKDIDFAKGEITVRDGKGGKDRVTMLRSARRTSAPPYRPGPQRPPRRSRRGPRLGRAAARPRPEIPECSPRVGLAMGLPRHTRLR